MLPNNLIPNNIPEIIQKKCTSISLQKEVGGVNVCIVEYKTPFTAFVRYFLKSSLLPAAFL